MATWRQLPIMHLRDRFCSGNIDATKVPAYFDSEYVREITRERLKFNMFLKTAANDSNNAIILMKTIIGACNDIRRFTVEKRWYKGDHFSFRDEEFSIKQEINDSTSIHSLKFSFISNNLCMHWEIRIWITYLLPNDCSSCSFISLLFPTIVPD